MPRISYVQMIDISPEKYLEACSSVELQETLLLLNTPRFIDRMNEPEEMESEEEPGDPRQRKFPWWDDVKQLKR